MDRKYRRIYGLSIPDVPIEAVTWRLSATAALAAVEPPLAAASTSSPARTDRRRAVKFTRGEPEESTPVYRRAELPAGSTLSGPAIVEERETTAVIRPGWAVQVARDGSLIATRKRSAP